MEKIAGVINMDGFVLDKTFYCKELGVLKLGEDKGRSFFFDIGVHWHHQLASSKDIVCFSQETPTSDHLTFLGELMLFHLGKLS